MLGTFKNAFLLLFIVSVTACAYGARPLKMVAFPNDGLAVEEDSRFYEAMTVEDVSGGKLTNPIGQSEVSDAALYGAMTGSLKAYGLLRREGLKKYIVDVELVGYDQPIHGYTYSINVTMKYSVRIASTNKTVFELKVTEPGTSTMWDALSGLSRLRYAKEFAIRNNIRTFIEEFVKRE